MFTALLVLSLSAVTATSIPSRTPDSLRFVAVVTRHGSRSPLSTFPADAYPYNDKCFWPDGPGELTNLGKSQLYQTGKTLRKRYNGFLEAVYYPGDTVAEYNPYTRDFNSAAALLAGLYPPVGPQIWNSQLDWQPIPISLRPFDVCDLAEPKGGCPRYKKEAEKMLAKLNVKNYQQKNLLDYISKSTGAKYTNLSQVYDIYDTLLMQAQNNYKLPEWSKQIFPTQVQPFAVTNLLLQYAGSDTLIKLGAGPELKHISDILTRKANGSAAENSKMYIEAAHDCTLIALLYAMGYNKQDLEIETGAYLVFELHEIVMSYVVQVYYYRNPLDEKPILVSIKKCTSPCSLTNFTSFVDSVNPKNWSKLCNESM